MTPWTVACQAPLSMGFPRQEYCSDELPFPSPGDLPHPGIEPMSPSFQGYSLPSEPSGKPFVRSTWTLCWRRKWQPTPVFLPRESVPRAAVPRVAQSRTQLKRLSIAWTLCTKIIRKCASSFYKAPYILCFFVWVLASLVAEWNYYSDQKVRAN